MTEPLPAGDCPHSTGALVDAAVEEAAQTLFSAADVPVARADELLALVQGPAVRAVLEARIDQVVKHGHTPAADAQLPLKWLPSNARSMIIDALDQLEDHAPARNLAVARRRLAKAAAMLIAAIDVVDLAIAERPEGGA